MWINCITNLIFDNLIFDSKQGVFTDRTLFDEPSTTQSHSSVSHQIPRSLTKEAITPTVDTNEHQNQEIILNTNNVSNIKLKESQQQNHQQTQKQKQKQETKPKSQRKSKSTTNTPKVSLYRYLSHNKEGYDLFKKFLVESLAIENLLFLTEAQTFRLQLSMIKRSLHHNYNNKHKRSSMQSIQNTHVQTKNISMIGNDVSNVNRYQVESGSTTTAVTTPIASKKMVNKTRLLSADYNPDEPFEPSQTNESTTGGNGNVNSVNKNDQFPTSNTDLVRVVSFSKDDQHNGDSDYESDKESTTNGNGTESIVADHSSYKRKRKHNPSQASLQSTGTQEQEQQQLGGNTPKSQSGHGRELSDFEARILERQGSRNRLRSASASASEDAKMHGKYNDNNQARYSYSMSHSHGHGHGSSTMGDRVLKLDFHYLQNFEENVFLTNKNFKTQDDIKKEMQGGFQLEWIRIYLKFIKTSSQYEV